MVSRTAWTIPFPPVNIKFAQVELGKIKDSGPVSREKVLRHILRGDFRARKVWHGKRYCWLVSSRSLAKFVARETFRQHVEVDDGNDQASANR